MKHVLACAIVFTAANGLAQTPALAWELDANPPSRHNFSLTYHAAAGATVLFGGVEGDWFADTWLWQDGWRRLTTPVAPSHRSNYAAAYDSLRARLVLFGGGNRTAVFGDTWAFDGTQWTQLAPLASPPARQTHSMSYDIARDRVVLRGGQLGVNGAWSTQLWEFDGTTWALIPQGGTVPGPFTTDIVYDAARGETLLLDSGVLSAWNGAQWQARSTAGLPANFCCGAMVYDPAGQRVLLLNPFVNSIPSSGVYASQGQGWSLVATTTPGANRNPLMMAMDTATQKVVGLQISASGVGYVPESHTFVFDGANWQQVLAGPPLGRRNAAMAYDSVRRRIVVHGGYQGTISTKYDTHELDGRSWHVASRGVGGGGLDRAQHRMVFDSQRAVTVMIGGTQQWPNLVAEWSGTGWSFQQPSFAPAVRWDPAMAYDSLRSRTLVFGGEGATQPNLGDLWAWNGLLWTNLTPASGPSPRRAAGLCYDSDRDRAVLFGGTDGAVFFADTWEFDGTTWAQQSPSSSPPARAGHVQVYDSHERRAVVFGGRNAQELRDTWRWDGVAWSQLLTPVVPDVGVGVCGAYDSARRELVLFGGVENHGEVWRLRNTGLGAWESRGAGCNTGVGPLTLAALDPVVIDRSSQLLLTNLPSHFAVLASAWVGFSDVQWNGLPLPVSLASVGSPACFVWAEPLVPVWLVNQGNGTADGVLAIPNDPTFVAFELYVQSVAMDFGAARISTANLLVGRIGVP